MKNILMAIISMIYVTPLYYLIQYNQVYFSMAYVLWLLMSISTQARKALEMDI